MIYLIVILLILIIFLSALLYPYITIRLHLTNDMLTILIKLWFYKKELKFNLSDSNTADKPTSSSADISVKDDEPKQTESIKSKLIAVKNRIFNPETGFDAEEARAVKDEFTQTYSQLMTVLKKFFGKMRQKIIVPHTSLTLDYGTGNPASTGMLYASFWSFTGIIYPLFARYAKIRYPIIDITPDFYEKRFSIELKSIIKVRPAHIINAAILSFTRFGLTYLKNNFRKEREK